VIRLGSCTQLARDSHVVAAQHGGGRGFAVAVAVAALAVAVVAGACTSGRSTATTPPATTTPAPVRETTTTTDPKQQVIAAYENYVQQFSRVSGDPNGRPDDPLLRMTMSTTLAKQVEVNIFGLRNLHRYTVGQIVVHPKAVDIEGASAVLLTCNRDDSDQYDQKGNDLSAQPGIGTPEQLRVVLLKASNGQWLVDQNAATGKGCTL
jgi:hypothetical protein